MTGGGGEGQDVGALGLVLRQVVEGVRVVPEDREVGGRGGHGGEAGRDLLRDDGAGRVGVGRDDPDALDARVVLDERLDRGDVGPVVVHVDGDHLDAERREHREVAVVAGHRADEADLLLLRPRPRGVDATEEQEVDDRAVHHREARVAARDDLRRLDPEQLGEDLAQLGQALEAAVVAHVDARPVRRRRRQPQQLVRQVELGRRRLAPRQVEPQPAGLEGRVG